MVVRGERGVADLGGGEDLVEMKMGVDEALRDQAAGGVDLRSCERDQPSRWR